ncbi:hypothetical protein [Sphingomonas sanxanigenens]|uniref:hypothetical protein n=1 Tax=Sphingomonas sanxanigenens TaxID=397260 RepID=UPI001301520D|nr:hypothetical protein [Sphingomonas sanxanigenens]
MARVIKRFAGGHHKPRRIRRELAAILLPLWLAGCATLSPPLLGGRASRDYERTLSDFGEPMIWRKADGKGFKRRLRFIIMPQLLKIRLSIRIEEPIRGKPYGELVVLRRMGESHFYWSLDERRRFRISPDDLEELNDLMVASELWTYERQTWRDPADEDDYMCIHGVDLLFERRLDDTYYTASGNGSCEVPGEVRAVLYKAMEMAGGPAFHF